LSFLVYINRILKVQNPQGAEELCPSGQRNHLSRRERASQNVPFFKINTSII
jgi:hypothetical protein